MAIRGGSLTLRNVSIRDPDFRASPLPFLLIIFGIQPVLEIFPYLSEAVTIRKVKPPGIT